MPVLTSPQTLETASLELAERDFSTYLSQLGKMHTPSLATKLTLAIAVLSDRPYRFDAQGDGYDSDIDLRPSLNTQFLDCVTFCEIVLAMIHSRSFHAMQQIHTRIRYLHSVKYYFHRHHFFDASWLVHNRANNIVTGPTLGRLARTYLTHTRMTLDLPNWLLYQKSYIETHHQKCLTQHARAIPEFYRHQTTLDVSYIPISRLVNQAGTVCENTLAQLPSCAIMLIICAHWNTDKADIIPQRMKLTGSCFSVTHLGFVTETNGQRYFSHARMQDKITTVALADYLRYIRLHLPYVSGVQFEGIGEPSNH